MSIPPKYETRNSLQLPRKKVLGNRLSLYKQVSDNLPVVSKTEMTWPYAWIFESSSSGLSTLPYVTINYRRRRPR